MRRRKGEHNTMIECACGCGQTFLKYHKHGRSRRFVRGHKGRKDFWAYVERFEDDCWIWKGCLQPDGYGQFRSRGKTVKAHRMSWEKANGPIPRGQVVCHHCDNPACVNPAHLFLGTQSDNIRDMMAKKRNRHPHGIKAGLAKLTFIQAQEIRRLYGLYTRSTGVRGVPNGQIELAKKYGVHRSTIQRIVTGKTHRKPDGIWHPESAQTLPQKPGKVLKVINLGPQQPAAGQEEKPDTQAA